MPTKVRCVTYTDAFSAGHCSYNDLLIGAKHNVVGCNSKVFGAGRPGDLVIITANKGKERFFTIGTLDQRLITCNLWADDGGHVWTYNSIYTPLIGIHAVTPAIKEMLATICTKYLVDPRYVMHSRFCGERYAPVLRDLVAALAAPKT
jgi:hypothetical protein